MLISTACLARLKMTVVRTVMFLWVLSVLSVPALRAADMPLNGHVFTLPDGFEITLAAGPDLAPRPITADFDDRGRLYVADSSGTNDPVKKQLEDRPHRIVRLEDTDGDGVYDKSSVFADRMMFPEGTLWHAGSLYVAAPPSIWKLTDTDGDGVADQREEWFQGKTLTGCANDLHGPYLGPDGWIYWCKGAFAEQSYEIQGKPWKTRASHIFRCRPDGTGLEPVMTGGMDNPVDVIFMPNGDRILSNTFIVHPGNGQRDGLLHAIYGGVYGKEHGVLEGHPRTGELMPILSHMGAAAPCGLARYDSDLFGAEYQDNLFACQFNKHKVSRHALTAKGASYESTDSDFVVSSNLDFHPTDVLEDADGSLLIVDTGGWYKLCCPTSQLHKPDILGGIYRVRRKGVRQLSDPYGLKIDWTRPELNQLEDEKRENGALYRLMADRRRVVARRARERRALLEMRQEDERLKGTNGTDATTYHFPPLDVQSRGRFVAGVCDQLWSWATVSGEKGLPSIRGHLTEHAHPQIRQVALHLISLYRDRVALPQVLALLKSDSPANRRLAAEAIGRLGERTAVPELLAAAARAGDRAEQHAIIYALIELADSAGTVRGLASDNVHIQRAALIALDQMSGSHLTAQQITPLLVSSDATLRETANWIISHHPEWGGELAGWFRDQLRTMNRRVGPAQRRPTGGDRTDSNGSGKPTDGGPAPHVALSMEELEQQLTRFAVNAAIQQLLAESIGDDTLSVEARQVALRAMAKSKPKEVPPVWANALAKLVGRADAPLLGDVVAAARDLPAPKQPHAELNAALLKVAADDAADRQTRLDAMAAVAGGMPHVSDEQFTFLLASLNAENPVVMRSSAADTLAKAKLSSAQLQRLTESVKTVGPLELDRLCVPFERSTDEQLGLQLLAALKQASALSSLRVDSVKQRLAKYSPAVQKGVDELQALVNVDAAAQKQRIEELLPTIAAGDIRRGQAIFNSTKAACVACHRFGYLGGSTGPDMTRIGGIRTERDLLESILYPSLSFVRSYEPVVIITTDGRVTNGLIRSETSTELLLATGPNQEVRITRADIEELRPSTTSIMPAGLDKQLTPQELADLVAFLKNAK